MDNTMIAAITGGTSAVLVVLTIVFYVLYVVGLWKMFTKMGEKGWKSLIPFYNIYIEFKDVWNKGAFWVAIILSLVTSCLDMAGTGAFIDVLACIAGIVTIVWDIMFTRYLIKSFGGGIGYTILMILFPSVMTIVIGFGKCEYIGNTTEK